MTIFIDLSPSETKAVLDPESEKRPRKSSKDDGDGKKTQSLIGRIVSKRGSIKPETMESAEAPPTGPLQGQIFGVPIESIASRGAPFMSSYGIPAFIEESLTTIRKNRNAYF